MWKFVSRYFFLTNSALKYTNTREEKENAKKHKVLISLVDIKSIICSTSKVEIVRNDGHRRVLKGPPEEINKYVMMT